MGSIAIAGGGGSSGLTVGATTITGGTPGDLLYDNSGILGEKAISFLTPAVSNVTYYISTTGSDSNNGLTPATAFATNDHAMAVIATFDWLNFTPTVQWENGTYTQNMSLGIVPSSTSPGSINANVIGNPATPSNVILADPGGTISLNEINTEWTVDGFQLNVGKNRTAIQNVGNGISFLSIDDIIFSGFGAGGTSDLAIKVVGYNFISVGVTHFAMSISGNWDSLLYAQQWSTIQGNGVVLTFSGATFSGFGGPVIFVDEFSEIDGTNGGFTFSGTTTGQRFKIKRHGALLLQNLGGTPIFRDQAPGNAVGVVDPSSIYTSDTLYAVATPLAGGTVTANAGQHRVILNPAGVLATLTVNLPTNMSDSETYGVSTSQTITALTVATTDGSAMVGAPTTLAANTGFVMMFDTAANTWYIGS